jgi:prepilin-type N-terminal cleavage/methylation domain-containing protein
LVVKNSPTRERNGFSLIEMIVALFIAFLVGMATLSLFKRANEGAISQDRITYMNSTLNSANFRVREAIAAAGFGLRSAPDYALRPINKVGNDFPGGGTFSAVYNIRMLGGATFGVKAKADSDALLTLHSDPACEQLTISRTDTLAASGWPASDAGNYTLIACLPQQKCELTQDTANNPLPPNPGDVLEGFNPTNAADATTRRVILLIDESGTKEKNVALRIAPDGAYIDNAGGLCGGNSYLRIQGTADGLQVGKSTSPNFIPVANDVTARLVDSHFFYLGENDRLYDIPLAYFTDPSEDQGTRVLAENVDSFQLQYYHYNDQGFLSPLNADQLEDDDLEAINPDDDNIAQTEAIRFVETDLRVRSERPDADYSNQGFAQQIFDGPVALVSDSYRRRSVRQQILAKNLNFFAFYSGTGLY